MEDYESNFEGLLGTGWIAAMLKASPDAGGWAVSSKLKSLYAVTIAEKTMRRWLEQHRDAPLDGNP